MKPVAKRGAPARGAQAAGDLDVEAAGAADRDFVDVGLLDFEHEVAPAVHEFCAALPGLGEGGAAGFAASQLAIGLVERAAFFEQKGLDAPRAAGGRAVRGDDDDPGRRDLQAFCGGARAHPHAVGDRRVANLQLAALGMWGGGGGHDFAKYLRAKVSIFSGRSCHPATLRRTSIWRTCLRSSWRTEPFSCQRIGAWSSDW